MLNLVAMIVDKTASAVLSSSSSFTATSPASPMSYVAAASVIAGSIVFTALIVLVAHASYKRRKEHNWHVDIWNKAESSSRMSSKSNDEKEKLLQ